MGRRRNEHWAIGSDAVLILIMHRYGMDLILILKKGGWEGQIGGNCNFDVFDKPDRLKL